MYYESNPTKMKQFFYQIIIIIAFSQVIFAQEKEYSIRLDAGIGYKITPISLFQKKFNSVTIANSNLSNFGILHSGIALEIQKESKNFFEIWMVNDFFQKEAIATWEILNVPYVYNTSLYAAQVVALKNYSFSKKNNRIKFYLGVGAGLKLFLF